MEESVAQENAVDIDRSPEADPAEEERVVDAD
jgi:hypothetical protein